jgi:hypothetical protein
VVHTVGSVVGMNGVLWFLFGLFVGLACDYLLVKIMLKSIEDRISILENKERPVNFLQ